MTGMKRVTCKRAWTAIVIICALATPVASTEVQSASLSLSGGSGAPGATVTLDVSLNPTTGTPPVSVQWDLTYSTSDLSLVTGTYDANGTAGTAAGKVVDCNIISAGDVRCIVSGINTTSIGNGVLATLTFQIASGTTDTSTAVSLVSPAASDGNANALSITGTGATVTINQPAVPVLSSLNCSPASVTPPATSTCTVSLSSAASSTTTINLSSGAAAATVPASVNITSGLSSTTFTVTTKAVSSSTPAEITAKLGSNSENFTVTLNPASTCAYSLSTNGSTVSSSAGSGSFNVVTSSGCSWSVTNNSTFITITAGSSGTGNGTVSYSFTANSGAGRIGTLTIATQTFTVTQSGQTQNTTAGLAFYPLTPCRVADTRVGSGFSGAFGAPSLAKLVARSFPIQQSACNVPATAQAYSFNITVVPPAGVTYLTAWPTGLATPATTTLNSPNGAVVGNAAIVTAGTSGAISLLASNKTDVVIDINGYFAPPTPQGLAFYPVTPCRVADTRTGSGFSKGFGSPSLVGGGTRNFAVQSSNCGIPSTAEAYSMRMTVVAPGPLGYLTTWPAGQPMPVVATLNALGGGVIGNQAIVPAGAKGAISVFVTNNTDLVIDINGYFGPPGNPGAIYFYPLTPCRVANTQKGSGFSGGFGPPSMVGGVSRVFPMLSSSCIIPSSALAYSVNMTVVVPANNGLGYLTAWPTGQAFPVAATLNATTGGTVAAGALVPAGTSGSISVFASNATDLIIDIAGYFGP